MPNDLLSVTSGIPSSILESIDITPNDVLSGKNYLGSDGEIHSGTLSFSGNAGTGDVISGKTFYSNSTMKQTGNLNLSSKISIIDIGIAPVGSERREGDASYNVGKTIQWCPIREFYASYDDYNWNKIAVRSYSGSTINYHWWTHGGGRVQVPVITV